MPHVRGTRRVSRCEECQHIHERQLRKLHTLTTQQSRTVNATGCRSHDLGRCWTARRNVCESTCIAKEQNSKIWNSFLTCCKHVMETFQFFVIKKSVCVKWCTDVQNSAWERWESDYNSWLRTQDGAVFKSSLIIQLHSGQ